MRNREWFKRDIIIDVCRDRTMSYRVTGQSTFNGAALPVFTVNSKDEARRLLEIVCVKNPGDHPHPDYKHDDWYVYPYKRQYLEIDDMDVIGQALAEAYKMLG